MRMSRPRLRTWLATIPLFPAAVLSAMAGAQAMSGEDDVVHALGHRQVGLHELKYPHPSQDGESVVFQGNMDGRWQLYRMSMDDEKISRLHVSAANDIHPAPSPDGEWIAFTSDRNGNPDIHVIELESGAVRALAPDPAGDGHPKWSPDGQWIYFNRELPADTPAVAGNEAIFRVRVDGSDLELVSNSPNPETFPAPSPDGKQVAFVEWFPVDGDPDGRNGEIILVDLETGTRRNLTMSVEFDGYPFWGASGRWVYFSSHRPGPDGRQEYAVFRMSPDDGGLERLTALDGRSDLRGIPTSDERRLIFNQNDGGGDGGRVQLFVQDLP